MPKIFGYQHILYLIISLIITAATIFLVKTRVKEEKMRLVALIAGIIFLALITANRVSIFVYGGSPLSLIPSTFCGFASFFFSLVLIFGKKDSAPLQFIAMITIVSGTISIIYPDFIGQANSFFYPPTITGLLHHSMQLLCSLLVLITGYLKPTIKRWAALPIGTAFFITFGAFLLTALKIDNAMQLTKPFVEGTILTWYFVLPLQIILYTIALLIFDTLSNPKSQRFLTKITDKLSKKKNQPTKFRKS